VAPTLTSYVTHGLFTTAATHLLSTSTHHTSRPTLSYLTHTRNLLPRHGSVQAADVGYNVGSRLSVSESEVSCRTRAGSLQYSESRNRRNSPLLRLPGELRNRVYEYAMSGVTISVFPAPKPWSPAQLHAHVADTATALTAMSSPSDTISLTRVCRQIHVETRLLPFRAFTFHINSDGSFSKFVDSLLPIQRDAISTIEMSTPDANEGGTLLHCVTRVTGNDFVSQKVHLDLLEWSSHLALDRLCGLKRVLVEEDKQWVYRKDNEPFLRDGISSCVMDRNIDIVLPASKTSGK
jgi:hypothetical protein